MNRLLLLPRPRRTEEEQQDEDEHNAREAAIDAEVDQPKKKKQKKEFKPRPHPHGTVPQAAWGPQDYADAKHKLQENITLDKSDTGKMFHCKEWGKKNQKYVQFRSIEYTFQTFAYFAKHPEDELQQDMSVLAYPCKNPLCIEPDHLFLRGGKKRGPKNTFLPPFDSKGLECVNRSQEALRSFKEELGEPDETLTEMISLYDYCKMTPQQQAAFQKTTYNKK